MRNKSLVAWNINIYSKLTRKWLETYRDLHLSWGLPLAIRYYSELVSLQMPVHFHVVALLFPLLRTITIGKNSLPSTNTFVSSLHS